MEFVTDVAESEVARALDGVEVPGRGVDPPLREQASEYMK